MSAENNYALKITGLTKKVNKKKILLDNISLTIKPHTLVAIIGPSGAGKTTLLKSICQKNEFENGNISFFGKSGNIQETIPSFGYVPQENIIHEDLKLKEMLFYYAKLQLPKKIKMMKYIKE